MIDPRHLANLLAIAKYGSFNRAAAARGLSQPALSNSIAQLERRLGVQVLNRSKRGSELNDFGKILARNAQTLEALLLQTGEEIRLKRSGVEGPLRIGVVPSMMLKFMPELMARLLKTKPAVELSLIEGLDDQLISALQTGDLDLVLGPLAEVFSAPQSIMEEALFDDPFSIGVAPHSALAKRRSLTLAELRDHPWVMPSPGSAYRRHVEGLFAAEAIPWPVNSIVTSSLYLLESIVAQTDRVTLITELQAAMHNDWRIRSIPLKNGGKRVLGIKRRRGGQLSPFAARVVQLAREVALSYQHSRRSTKARR